MFSTAGASDWQCSCGTSIFVSPQHRARRNTHTLTHNLARRWPAHPSRSCHSPRHPLLFTSLPFLHIILPCLQHSPTSSLPPCMHAAFSRCPAHTSAAAKLSVCDVFFSFVLQSTVWPASLTVLSPRTHIHTHTHPRDPRQHASSAGARDPPMRLRCRRLHP
jgi:hypothetical protein